MSVAAVLVGLLAAGTAKILVLLIAIITNLAFFGKFSLENTDPSGNHLGYLLPVVPVIGGLIVGLMAKFGSRAICGHGIPEAMEQVLTNESRIPPKMTILKPVSAAVAIGTGGPFGAEGPIIATGGALGSIVGQLLHTTALERKTLLASGAAAGMTAIFGTPIAALLLAVELLLFEFRPRTLVPVGLACVAAGTMRTILFPPGAVFAMPALGQIGGEEMVFYLGLGLVVGLAAVGVTKLVYGVEAAFEHLPLHWSLWPAIGGLAVGVVGIFAPRTLGVGYSNISDVLNGRLVGPVLITLCLAKLVSWALSLGSGTSGGTLAPLLTIGGCLGAFAGTTVGVAWGIDPRLAALVGMAALFCGASRALLTSIVFALEVTGRPEALLPLLCCCTVSYLVSFLLSKDTIMTEKITKRGVYVPQGFVADRMSSVTVGHACTRDVVSLPAWVPLSEARETLSQLGPCAKHGAYPVVDRSGSVVGLITRHDLADERLPVESNLLELSRGTSIAIGEDATLRDAADLMAAHEVGRLPVTNHEGKLVGILSQKDLMEAHRAILHDHTSAEKTIRVGWPPTRGTGGR